MNTEIKIKVAANISYDGFTYNTPLFVEYKHTGKQYFFKRGKRDIYTQCPKLIENLIKSGKKIIEKQGYYYISRLAIPTINAKGEADIWYINNDGDTYTVNKVSKYWRKIHQQLANNINPFN